METEDLVTAEVASEVEERYYCKEHLQTGAERSPLEGRRRVGNGEGHIEKDSEGAAAKVAVTDGEETDVEVV